MLQVKIIDIPKMAVVVPRGNYPINEGSCPIGAIVLVGSCPCGQLSLWVVGVVVLGGLLSYRLVVPGVVVSRAAVPGVWAILLLL